MPSRLVTTAIILFWLATTGWLVYRELAPRFRAGEPPPFTIDLTDEVGSSSVSWHVLQGDGLEPVGRGTTRIKRNEDRTFEFSAEFSIRQFDLLAVQLTKTEIRGSYRVTEEGRLVHAATRLGADVVLPIAKLDALPIVVDFEGDVREGRMHPALKVSAAGVPVQLPPVEPFAVADSGSILNPMHLVHKIGGLREGRTWRIPLMDPLRAVPGVRDAVVGTDLVMDHVQATVTTATLTWSGEETPCYKIEYRRPEGEVIAETWVSRRDDVVLQQSASYQGIGYTLQRVRQ